MESTQLPPTHAIAPLMSANSARGDLFRQLNLGLPLNQYNLPDFIYRVDMIPLNYGDYPADQKVQFMNAAALEVTFEHGYPALFESKPFWEKLPSEPEDAFNAFMIYLELPEKTAHDNPVRMLPMIAELTKIPLEDIVAYSHMYYWHWRGRAYDLFIIACHRKQRELRLMSVEGQHFKMAEKFLKRMETVIEAKFNQMESEEGAMDEIKLKDAVDSMQKLVQIQRISVGLSANGVTQFEGPKHASSGDLMQHIAAESGKQEESSQRSPEMDRLLESPEDLARVQDLITRLHVNSEH